jgi:D-lactate dehydrogenase (quinone)
LNTSERPPLPRARLQALFGPEALLTEAADCWPYGYDNSRRHALPQAVCFATSEGQVRELVRLCVAEGIPLVARGRGTGTTGATVPDQGGIVLSLERMARILEIDPANRLARVEPGVTNRELQQALAAHGFFWPPDPTSAPVCTIGGNLAYNAAGPRAVKYGTPRENTLGLRAVTGRGELIRTGVRTTKGVVGYDLTRLLIGSEGTLAVITEALLKLTPLPEARRTLRASYRDLRAATQAVSAIMAQPVTPCALEFMDGAALEMVRGFSPLDLEPDCAALLMIEVDGPAHCIDASAAALAEAARNPGLLALHQAATPEEVAQLWRTRNALSPALRNIAPKKINEDVVVPVSRIPELIDGLQEIWPAAAASASSTSATPATATSTSTCCWTPPSPAPRNGRRRPWTPPSAWCSNSAAPSPGSTAWGWKNGTTWVASSGRRCSPCCTGSRRSSIPRAY